MIRKRREVLLDTSGWLAALNPREQHHDRARRTYESLLAQRTRLVTTSLIVAEMHILISRSRGPEAAVDFLDALYADTVHEVVHVDRDLEQDGIDGWLRKHRDVRLSLADATAFALAHRRGIETALALDRHFSFAGLTMLP